MSSMSYRDYLSSFHLRITDLQHRRIREIVGFKNTNKNDPFTNEPIDMWQAVQIAELFLGETYNDWITKTFNEHRYETKELISLSTFMMFLITDFKIGVEEQGKVPARPRL